MDVTREMMESDDDDDEEFIRVSALHRILSTRRAGTFSHATAAVPPPSLVSCHSSHGRACVLCRETRS